MSGEITKQYFIGDKESYETPAMELHKKFNEKYNKNFISEEIPSALFNYKINRVNLQFHIYRTDIRKLTTTKITCQGLEKNINKLINEVQKEFRIEAN